MNRKPMTVAQFIGRETRSHRHKYNRLLPKVTGLYGSYREDMLGKVPGRDHAFHCGPYMISRPYGFGIETMRELVEFARQFEFEVIVGGVTSWHPATVTVEIYREAWRQTFFDHAEQYGDAFKASVSEAVYYRVHGAVHRVHRRKFGRESETGLWVLNNTVSRHGVGGGDNLKVAEILRPEPTFTIDPDTYP